MLPPIASVMAGRVMIEQKARVATTDYQRTRDAVETVAGSIAEMLRHAPDTSVRIPNWNWTVGEGGAHLVATQDVYRDGLKGHTGPYGDGHADAFDAVNKHMLVAFGERDGATLADMLVDRTRSFLKESAQYPENHRIPYHWPMDLPTWTSYMLVHLLMHGWPIAKALDRPSPLEPAHTDLAVPFFKVVMPAIFDKEAAKGLKANLEVRLRGGRRFTVAFKGESVTVEDTPPGRVDCHLSADPVAFFLVSLGLVGQWG